MSGVLARPRFRRGMTLNGCREHTNYTAPLSAEDIAKCLGGRKSSGNWQCRCPAHDDKTPSLSLRDGDDGKVLLHCFGGCDPLDIIAELQRRDLWPNRNERREWLLPPIRPKPKKLQEPDNAARAREIWHEATDPRGTRVIDYLASRGLILPDNVAGRVIRFHGDCPFTPGHRYACMIARYSPIQNDLDPESPPSAIHRVRIDKFKFEKSEQRKRTLGPSAGQCVKLSPDEDICDGLGICEGIETGLSLLKIGWHPVWALAMQKFPVLDGIESLSVFVDHDANQAGQNAAAETARQWERAGLEVRRFMPKQLGHDWNDEVMS